MVAPVRIGKGAVTGAGSVVTKNHNVAPGKTVVGIPARVLKKGKTSHSRAGKDAYSARKSEEPRR